MSTHPDALNAAKVEFGQRYRGYSLALSAGKKVITLYYAPPEETDAMLLRAQLPNISPARINAANALSLFDQEGLSDADKKKLLATVSDVSLGAELPVGAELPELEVPKIPVANVHFLLEEGNLTEAEHSQLLSKLIADYEDAIKGNLSHPRHLAAKAEAAFEAEQSGEPAPAQQATTYLIGQSKHSVKPGQQQRFIALVDVLAFTPSDYPGYRPEIAREVVTSLASSGYAVTRPDQLNWGTTLAPLVDKVEFLAGDTHFAASLATREQIFTRRNKFAPVLGGFHSRQAPSAPVERLPIIGVKDNKLIT